MLSLQGPKSKEILQMVSTASFDNESFPVSSNQWIEVAGHKVNIIMFSRVLHSSQSEQVKCMKYLYGIQSST